MTGYLRISIDGPTGAGKTTLGTALATHFDAAFLDTGLTYRALALLLAKGSLPDDDSWNEEVCHIPFSADCPERVLLRGHDVTDDLWATPVDALLDHIARDPAKRAQILSFHHQILAHEQRIVAAGRDVAISLLAKATLHVFLTAEFAVRSERKRLQLAPHASNSGRGITRDVTSMHDLQTLEECRILRNSIVLDTTHVPAHEILNQVISKTYDIAISQP
jgi:cytidylate kinase